MKNTYRNLALLVALATSFLLTACKETAEPSAAVLEAVPRAGITIIHNARIYTFDAGNSWLDNGSMAFSGKEASQGWAITRRCCRLFPVRK